MQIPFNVRPDESVCVEFMRMYAPNSIYWPQSLKPTTLDQVCELVIERIKYEHVGNAKSHNDKNGNIIDGCERKNNILQPIEKTCANKGCSCSVSDWNEDEMMEGHSHGRWLQ